MGYILRLFLVRMTGFPPVAALADKQSTGLFGPADKLLRNFLPISNPTTLIKQRGRTTRARPLCLVRMTGFEPTRISSLEPETSASAVPPHPLISLKNENKKGLRLFSLFQALISYHKAKVLSRFWGRFFIRFSRFFRFNGHFSTNWRITLSDIMIS